MTVAIIIALSIFGVLFGAVAVAICFTDVDTKCKVVGILVCIFLWLFVSGCLILDVYMDRQNWNDGTCECGGEWELAAVSESRFGTKTKYYVCNECGHEIEQ